MDDGGGNYFKRQTMAKCGCMAAQVKVRECGLGQLPPWLNGCPVYDNSTSKGVCL